jgi:queuine/archaeosine tRNA-ribosyltransferase
MSHCDTKVNGEEPTVWLGQSVDTSSICASHPELSRAHFLTSFGCSIRRPSLLKTHFNCGLRNKLGVSGPLMIDSGGFALMKNPNPRWTVYNVAKLIGQVEAEIFVSLDLPPSNSDSARVRRSKIFRSFHNFCYLSSRFPHKIIMPVVHGRTLSEIELSIELLLRFTARPAWIGLGGIVPLLQNRYSTNEISKMGAELFIATALTMMRQAFPQTKIHAFGAGGTRTFPAAVYFGADSGDSIGWRQAAGFGSIFLPLKSQRAVIWDRTKRAPRKLLDTHDLDLLEACRCPVCLPNKIVADRVRTLQDHFYNRSIHNAWTVKNQFRYWPNTKRKMRDFMGEGRLGQQWANAVSRLNSQNA